MIIEYPLYEIIIPLISFVILYIILYALLLWLSPKFKNLHLKYKVALLTGLSHFILTTFLCIYAVIYMKSEPMIGMVFFFLRFFDYPFFFILDSIDNIFRNIVGYNLSSNVIAPFVAFSILGSLTYFCIGLIAGRIVEKFKDKRIKK